MKSNIGSADGRRHEQSGNRFVLENSGLQQCGHEEITNTEGDSVIRVEDGSNNAVELSCVAGDRLRMPDEGSKKLVSETYCAAGGAAGTVIRKRKILVKTVRVVKKVIKKRVPKKVLIGGTKIQGDVMRAEEGGRVDQANDAINTVHNLTESLNLVKNDVNMVEHKPSSVYDVLEEEDPGAEVPQNLETTCARNVSRPVGSEEVDDLSQMELETSEPVMNANVLEEMAPRNDWCGLHNTDADDRKGSGVVCEEEGLRAKLPQILEIVSAPNVSGLVVGEEDDDLAQMKSEMSKPVPNANGSDPVVTRNYEIGIYNTDAYDVKGSGAVCEVEANNTTKHCGYLEADEGKLTLGTINERENIVTDNQLKDGLMGNQRIDSVNKAVMELLRGQSVGPTREESGISGEKENGRPIVKDDSCSHEVESDRNEFTEGLLLSEEMEALERKKQRRTEIFLGGLSKDTKEEDVRKVFEKVGLVVDVRLVVNPKTRKNRGFAFVRFATAADAENALAKYSKVKIRGGLCNAALVEGNDTIYLGNIDRNWLTEDIIKFLEKSGIEKIDKVTLKSDPNNAEKNRGFAFVELQTSKDAQTAFNKLQKKNAFGKNQMVKVAWAQSLNEPAQDKNLQMKSVYAEYLPSSWDEEKVKEYFKRFGEIESINLAKDLYSSSRRDFAVINYTTHDAALTCIEAVNKESLGDDLSKVKMVVSFAEAAKPILKREQVRHTFSPSSRQHLEAKQNILQTSKKKNQRRNKGKATSSSYGHVKAVNRPYTTSTTSTTEELVHLLRQQASTNHNPTYPGTGAIMPDHRFLLPGSKRPFSLVGHGPPYVETQGLSRVRMESSYQFSVPSSSHGVGLLHPPYHHQPGPQFPSELINGRRNYPSPFQTRDRASYYENTNPYHRH